jgi:DNA-binding beta-propeller fold protein YncE
MVVGLEFERFLPSGDAGAGAGLRGRRRRPARVCLAALAVGASLLAGCGSSGNPAVVQVSPTGGSCPGGAVTSLGARMLAGTPRRRAARCPYDLAAGIGKPGEGLFRQPGAVAVGPAGRVYVADQFSHLVQVFSSTGAFEGQWGTGGAGPGQFGGGGGLAVDSLGNVYIVDAGHDRVEKFTAAGRLITHWGGQGTGLGQFRFGGGGGSYQPPGGGIAVGRSYVYVSDTGNNRIVRFTLNGSGARVVVGAGSGRGEVLRPHGLALAPALSDGAGRQPSGARGGAAQAPEVLYVADDGNDRVQELDAQGHFIAEAGFFLAAPNRFENPPAAAPGGFVYNNATHEFVRRSVPFDVAVHGGLVYVADDNYGAIVKLTRDLRFAGSFSGSGGERLSHFVRAVATDAVGRVYVTDASANRVVVFDSSGTPLHSWGASGTAPGQFLAPVDVAAGPGGELLVAEPHRGTGEIVPLYAAGTPLSYRARIAYKSLWSSGGGVRLGTRFFSPTAVAFAPDGSVWVADRNNKLLRHLSAGGRFLGAVGAPASAGPASLTEAHGLAVDSGGGVIVADTGANKVFKLAPDGRALGVWSRPGSASGSSASAARAAHGFHRPLAVAAGARGTIFVANTGNARVVQLDAAGRLIATWGGRGRAPGRFVAPGGIVVDSAGHVFVSDGVLDRIQEFTSGGKLLALWGAGGSSLGELSEPAGMTVDCHGDLLVADTGNNRVQLFTSVAAPAACKA